MASAQTEPKGRPTPGRGRQQRSSTIAAPTRTPSRIDPRWSWALLAVLVVAGLVALAVLGIGEGGPAPAGGHGG